MALYQSLIFSPSIYTFHLRANWRKSVHPQPPVFAGTDAISVTGEVTIPVAGVVIEFRKKFGGQAATVGDAFAILFKPRQGSRIL